MGVGSTCSNLVPLAGVRLMGLFRYTFVYLGVKVVTLNSAIRIAKNRVILVFIIADLPVDSLKLLFTRFLTAFYMPPFFCVCRAGAGQEY